MNTRKSDKRTSDALDTLLSQRYGDGHLYFEDDRDRDLFDLAVTLGYASEDGCLTVDGKRLSLAAL